MKRILLVIVLLAGLGGAVGYRYFVLEAASKPAAAQTATAPAPAAVPVVVAPVKRQPMPVRLDTIGTVQAISTVAIKSRIDGLITDVLIQDGQEVKAGDVLFNLDSRAAEAQLHQAEAQLTHDKAQHANAKREVERQTGLAEKQFVSRQAFDLLSTNAQALVATLQADEATIENYRVQLSYYTIASPLDGRAGVVTLKTGSNVKANDLPLVTLNQMQPIYVNFSVPQQELHGVRKAMKAGPVTVVVQLPGDYEPLAEGKIAFLDNTVDVATGTIAVRGIFDNTGEKLWPGQFLNVSVTLRVDPDALVVPSAAVQVGQSGSFVFVIRPDKTAEMRPVTVARTIDGVSVVPQGLAQGEQVVVDGQLRLTNGTRVELKPAPNAGPAKVGPAS